MTCWPNSTRSSRTTRASWNPPSSATGSRPPLDDAIADAVSRKGRSYGGSLAAMLGLDDRFVDTWLVEFHDLSRDDRTVILRLFRRTGSRHAWLPPLEPIDMTHEKDAVSRAMALLRELQQRTLAR